jgi:hypothetical protein
MSLRNQVNRDIELCKQVMESKYIEEAMKLAELLTAAYVDYIPDIRNDLTYYNSKYSYIEINVDYIRDVEIIKKKLELFHANKCTPIQSIGKQRSGSSINIHNNNSNTNDIDITIDIDFDQVREQISKSGMLHPDQISEILEKLTEIENVYDSEDNKNNKWARLKGSLEWLSTKGVDVAV